MQALWDLGRLELWTREDKLLLEAKSNCVQDRKASSFSKAHIGALHGAAHDLQ